MPFSDLIGNDKVKLCLQHMLKKNEVPQTLLFIGQDGIGKSLFAKRLAALIMGEKHAEKIEKGIHPDYHCHAPEGKNAQYSIATIRKIIEESRLPSFEAPAKIFILQDAHDMPPVASNALLKTFEEPHPDTYFILLSSQPQRLLPTILSRSCEIHFHPVAASLTEDWLGKLGKSSDEARLLSLLADGSPGKALQAGEIQARKKEVLELLIESDYRKILPILQGMDKRLEGLLNEDPAEYWKAFDQMLGAVLYWYRDLYALKSGAGEKLFFQDEKDLLEKVNELPPFEKVVQTIHEAKACALRNMRFKTVFEKLLLDLGGVT